MKVGSAFYKVAQPSRYLNLISRAKDTDLEICLQIFVLVFLPDRPLLVLKERVNLEKAKIHQT